MTKKIEVFASEALPGELEDFPDIKRGWGTTKESTGGIPPMKWFNAIQKRTDENINDLFTLVSNDKIFHFLNADEMVSSNNLKIGDYAVTSCYRYIGDQGGALYEIVAESNDIGDKSLSNGLYAKLLTINLESIGLSSGDDATDAIHYILNKGIPLYIKNKYKVSVKKSSYAIKIPSDSYIEFIDNGSLELVANDKEKYEMLHIAVVKNVTIVNPVLIGDKKTHIGTGGEWGHGIYITASQNVFISNPNVSDMWGDGLCITTPTEPDMIENENATKNIHILNGFFHGCRRQGFSVTGGRDLFFYGKQVCKDIKGAPPEGAFDIEVNNFVPLIGLSIQNVVGVNCNGYTFNLYSNDGVRVMKNIDIGSLVSVNGRRGSLNIARTEKSEIGYLKNFNIENLHQSITDDYTGDTNACNGVYIDKAVDINIGNITTDYSKSGAYTFRAVNGASVSVSSLTSNGGKTIQCSNSILNIDSLRVLPPVYPWSNEQLYVSSNGLCNISKLTVENGKFNTLVAGDDSVLNISLANINSKNSERDSFFRVMTGGKMSLNNAKFNVSFKGNVIQNQGELFCNDVVFGFDRVGATGVLAESNSKSYIINCSMIESAKGANSSIGIFESGSSGYISSCTVSETGSINIKSGSNVISKSNTYIYQ